LAVIILGVLVALWADGWVQRSAERRVEASRIVALGDNVSATRERLAEALGDAESAAAALRVIASWEAVPELDDRAEDLLLQALLFGPVFTPEINVYIDLKSSGDLGLLRSAELRQALARMDATLEQLRFLQDDLITVQQLNYDPFVIETLSLDGGFADAVGVEGVPRGPKSVPGDLRLLRNLALFKLDLVSQLVGQLNETSQTLDAVEQALDSPH
jgi:hypothetical protein